VFGLVGRSSRGVRPVAVADVGRVLAAAAMGDERLHDRTIFVLGPEWLSLEAAVKRVAAVAGRRPVFVPLPVAVHRLLAWGWEASMDVPLVARAQVEILAEGLDTPLADSEPPPPDLAPTTPFEADAIRLGLPEPSAFGCRDLRWCDARLGGRSAR
jgi:uncharacterized protein YbjT (DUF2867 family)